MLLKSRPRFVRPAKKALRVSSHSSVASVQAFFHSSE